MQEPFAKWPVVWLFWEANRGTNCRKHLWVRGPLAPLWVGGRQPLRRLHICSKHRFKVVGMPRAPTEFPSKPSIDCQGLKRSTGGLGKRVKAIGEGLQIPFLLNK